ncbi:MAG: hypothetical protein GC149_03000 [Gammaproteobacteria bacterium]|nr:hypothetical protein [Gammaproteobacteria bacterium]
MRYLLLLMSFLMLAACAAGPFPVTSPYYQIPAGSKLVLKQKLVIPPNESRVYIQYGKVISAKEKDNFEVNCYFLSWDVLNTSQEIKPDTFVVIKSTQNDKYVKRQTRTQLAMRGMGVVADSDSPYALEYSTEMVIHSDRQPRIRRFTCSVYEQPTDTRQLTVAEMQRALGKIVEIQLNTAQ